jgi:hypothetical protein
MVIPFELLNSGMKEGDWETGRLGDWGRKEIYELIKGKIIP